MSCQKTRLQGRVVSGYATETQNAGLLSEKTEKDTIYILSRKNATQNLNGFSKKQERITMNHVS